jgi:hypothetical protein
MSLQVNIDLTGIMCYTLTENIFNCTGKKKFLAGIIIFCGGANNV